MPVQALRPEGVPSAHDGRTPECKICHQEHLIRGDNTRLQFLALGFLPEEIDAIFRDADHSFTPVEDIKATEDPISRQKRLTRERVARHRQKSRGVRAV